MTLANKAYGTFLLEKLRQMARSRYGDLRAAVPLEVAAKVNMDGYKYSRH